MIPLIDAIYQKISEVSPRVFLEDAEDNTTFPYVVYSFPNSNELDVREDFTLEVTIWGKGDDTIPIETLTTNIDKELNRMRYKDSNAVFYIHRVNRMMIPSPDPDIRRRELRYEVRTYFI